MDILIKGLKIIKYFNQLDDQANRYFPYFVIQSILTFIAAIVAGTMFIGTEIDWTSLALTKPSLDYLIQKGIGFINLPFGIFISIFIYLSSKQLNKLKLHLIIVAVSISQFDII